MYRTMPLLAAVLLLATPVLSQDTKKGGESKEIPEPKSSITKHQIQIGGKSVAYTATSTPQPSR